MVKTTISPIMRMMRELDKVRRKEYARKICMARHGTNETCRGKIVNAHAISKKSTLRPISRAGKVISYELTYDANGSNQPGFELVEYGISRASQFPGFCTYHDTSLFSCIENHAFEARIDQCFALAFRSASFELYGQLAQDRVFRRAPAATKHLGPSVVETAREWSEQEVLVHARAREGACSLHGDLSRLLQSGTVSGMRHLVLAYDDVLPYAFTGAFAPIWDFKGQMLQTMADGPNRAAYLVVNTITGGGRSHVVLSMMPEPDASAAPLFHQLLSMPVQQAGHAAAELALEGTGRSFFRPDWILSLSDQLRSQLDRLLTHGATDASGPTPWAGLASFPNIPSATAINAIAAGTSS